MKPHLRTVESKAPTLHDSLRAIVKLDAEQADAQRLERQKMKLDSALDLIAKTAGCPRSRFAELDKVLQTIPQAPEYAAIHAFLHKFTRLAAEVPGNLVPPLSNWIPSQDVPALAMGCLMLHASPIELVGVCWFRAGRESPQTFKDGCDDPTAHEQHIADLARQREALLIAAANAVGLADLDIQFGGTGSASVTYKMTGDDLVPASGPGDPSGIPALVAWLHQHPEALEPCE